MLNLSWPRLPSGLQYPINHSNYGLKLAYYYLVIVKAKSVSLSLGVSTKGSEGKMHKSRFSELWLENEHGDLQAHAYYSKPLF